MKTLPFKFSRKGSACTERFSYLDFTMNTRILASLAPEFPDSVKCLQLGGHLGSYRFLWNWCQISFFIAFSQKNKILSKQQNIQNYFFVFPRLKSLHAGLSAVCCLSFNQRWFSVHLVLLFHNIMFMLGLWTSASVQHFLSLSLFA